MPKLIYFSTDGKWLEYPLGELTRIGRHPDQDLQLLDRMISKAHAEIAHIGANYVLRDVGSRNGTVLNEETVTSPVILRDGDEISVGNHVLRFVLDFEGETDPKTTSKTEPKVEQDCRTVIDCVDKVKDPSSVLSELLFKGTSSKEEFERKKEDRRKPRTLRSILTSSGHESIRKRVTYSAFLPESQILSEAELRRDYEKLRVAAELSMEAASTFDIDKLLGIIIDKAFQLFRADRAAILLRDDQGVMQTCVAVNRNGSPIDRFKISESLLDEVIGEKSAVLSADALQDQRFVSSKSLVIDNVRSAMCVPLLNQVEVIGVIYLDTQMMTGAFLEKDLIILASFACQAAMTIQQSHVIDEMRQNAIIRNNLRRIISPHLIDDVMSGKIELQKSGSRTEATVLFADIRGFSHMTEQNEPEDIVGMLNEYFETMVDCVFRHDGIVDKFVGDEVMAIWGVNVAKSDHTYRAVLSALDMMSAIDELNRDRSRRQLPPIQIGIGVATGIMIAGYMGSTQAMSYTVIGDTVNLGSRLCSAAQAGEILMDSCAWNDVRESVECTPLPPIMVKGKMEPVSVFRVKR